MVILDNWAHSTINGISTVTHFAPMRERTMIFDSVDGIIMVANDGVLICYNLLLLLIILKRNGN